MLYNDMIPICLTDFLVVLRLTCLHYLSLCSASRDEFFLRIVDVSIARPVGVARAQF